MLASGSERVGPAGRTSRALTELGQKCSNTKLFPTNSDVDASDEAHLSTLEDPPRADPWLPGPHEDGRRPQGALGASCEGSRPAHALTESGAPGRRVLQSERRYRLAGVGVFDSLFRAGRRHQGRWVELVYAPAASPPGRAGLAVSRKVLPRAVDRNRFKRKLREAFRTARPGIETYDVIVRLKRAPTPRAIDDSAGEAGSLLLELARGGWR